jgi:hypothetical protein
MSWLACMEKSMDIDDVLNLHDATSLYVFKWLDQINFFVFRSGLASDV